MKKNLTHSFLIIALALSPAIVSAETIIGKVHGKKKWIAYVKSGSSEIYIRNGKTAFASKCGTDFKVKGNYVSGPDGSSYNTKSQVLTAIQVRLNRGRYSSYGCK